MEQPEQDKARIEQVLASASRIIVLEERRSSQSSEIIYVSVNRTLFLLLTVGAIISNRGFGISLVYFLLIAAVLCAVWLWELAVIRAKARTIGDLVSQVEYQLYGSITSVKSWADVLIKLSYLSNYGSSPLTSQRWRMIEPISWLALMVILFLVVRLG